jgi:hypothetical protein
MLVLLQIHTFSAKRDSFYPESQPLFRAGFLPEFDFTTGADHSLPWNLRTRNGSEKTRDSAVVEGITRRSSDLSVGRDRSPWNREDHSSERRVAYLMRARTIARNRALRLAGNSRWGLALCHLDAGAPICGQPSNSSGLIEFATVTHF